MLVEFINGDPDQPLVTGCVYNERHMPPHELKKNKFKSTVMTRSFPNGGKDNFNELTFHDEKDEEEIYLHAEKNFTRVVEHQDVLKIGEKDTGGQEVTIEGDQTLTINQGNQTNTIKQGNRETTLEAGDHVLVVGEAGMGGMTESSDSLPSEAAAPLLFFGGRYRRLSE